MKKVAYLIIPAVLLSILLLVGCAQQSPNQSSQQVDEPQVEDTQMDDSQLVGAYGEDRPLTPEDRAIFDEAMAGLMGVSYEPLLVSTQVVAGLNYRFTAEATVVAPDAEPTKVFIYIFQPLGDEPPELVEIVDE